MSDEAEPPFRPTRWCEPYPVGEAPGWFPNKDRDMAIRSMTRNAKAAGHTLGEVVDMPAQTVVIRGEVWRIAYVQAKILDTTDTGP